MDRNAPMTIPELGLLDFFGFKEVHQCKIYYCARVKLRLFCVILKVFQYLYKSRRKRNPNEITDYFVCKCVDVTYFKPLCTSAYHMEEHKTYNGYEP